MSELAGTGPRLVAKVFRCACGRKHTIGVDYLEQVGPWPEECDSCGDPWTRVEDRHEEAPGDD